MLVTGATGTQGGAVVRSLLASGEPVRALPRDPSSPRARGLVRLGVEVVAEDLRDASSLVGAVAGSRAVFSVQDFYAPGVGLEGEVRQGRNLAEAASRAGVGLFVQSTMASAEPVPDVDHFHSKRIIESVIDDLGLPRAFLGTVWLTDNVSNPRTGGRFTFPALAGTLTADTTFHLLSADDLGRAAAAVLAAPEAHVGRRHDLASEVTTPAEMRATYRAVTGRHAKRWAMPHLLLRRLAPEYAQQLRWQRHQGWTHTADALEQLISGTTTFATYLHHHPVRL